MPGRCGDARQGGRCDEKAQGPDIGILHPDSLRLKRTAENQKASTRRGSALNVPGAGSGFMIQSTTTVPASSEARSTRGDDDEKLTALFHCACVHGCSSRSCCLGRSRGASSRRSENTSLQHHHTTCLYGATNQLAVPR